MPLNAVSEDNGNQFRKARIRELDTLMEILAPWDRPGYLESAYVKCLEEKHDGDYLKEMAALLMKWSNEKHSFKTHAEKLLGMNGGAAAEVSVKTRDSALEAISEESAG